MSGEISPGFEQIQQIDREDRLEAVRNNVRDLIDMFGTDGYDLLSADEKLELEEFCTNLDLENMRYTEPYHRAAQRVQSGQKISDPKYTSGHDLLHTLAKMKENGGAIVPPAFIKSTAQRIDPTDASLFVFPNEDLYYEELYPDLMSGLYSMNNPSEFASEGVLGTGRTTVDVLTSPHLRSFTADRIETGFRWGVPGMSPRQRASYERTFAMLRGPIPETVEERVREFEQLEKEADIQQSTYMRDEEEQARLDALFDRLVTDPNARPAYYRDLAFRAFSDERKQNPRFFYDEILAVARMVPPPNNAI